MKSDVIKPCQSDIQTLSWLNLHLIASRKQTTRLATKIVYLGNFVNRTISKIIDDMIIDSNSDDVAV
jgi:hypothetical protein